MIKYYYNEPYLAITNSKRYIGIIDWDGNVDYSNVHCYDEYDRNNWEDKHNIKWKLLDKQTARNLIKKAKLESL